jgi:hypothetical protein
MSISSLDLESRLTEAGCKVIGSAGTLEGARALVEHADCDAALLDVNLAGHSVAELAIKAHAKEDSVRVRDGVWARSASERGPRQGHSQETDQPR